MKTLLNNIKSAFYIKDSILYFKNDDVVINSSELSSKQTSISLLTYFIYKKYYTEEATESGLSKNIVSLNEDNSFINKLSLIHKNKKIISDNWLVVKTINNETLLVKKNNLTLEICTKKHIDDFNRKSVYMDGDLVSILFSCHFPNVSPGFYVFKSDKKNLDTSNNIGRLYFNLKYDSALIFIETLLEKLYDKNYAFDFKVFKNLKTIHRIDNGVLYFQLDYFNDIKSLVEDTFGFNNEMLNKKVSLFHYSITGGIGFAEEQINSKADESYGLNRCKFLAETICDNFSILEKKQYIPLNLFINKFKENSIDLNFIFLNPDSKLKNKLI